MSFFKKLFGGGKASDPQSASGSTPGAESGEANINEMRDEIFRAVATALAYKQKGSFSATPSGLDLSQSTSDQKYFEVPVEVSVFRCSDRQCSCPGTESLIPGESLYLYISQEVVDMRKDCLTFNQLNQKVDRVQRKMGAVFFFDTGTIWPIGMCRQAAENRGLDLDVAAADAKHWTATGLVPLRVTPTLTR